jgi:hypothetical protein
VTYVLAYTICTAGYEIWNTPLLTLSAVTAVVDAVQDWVKYIQ